MTQNLISEDGWFHTGDAGYMKDGFLYLTDRIKDLFKTSNGKYIAPQAIETKLVVDRYIDQVSIIADQRKFVSALIVPEYRKWRNTPKSTASLIPAERFVAEAGNHRFIPNAYRYPTTRVRALRANQEVHFAPRTVQHGERRTDQYLENQTSGLDEELCGRD